MKGGILSAGLNGTVVHHRAPPGGTQTVLNKLDLGLFPSLGGLKTLFHPSIGRTRSSIVQIGANTNCLD